MQDTLDWFCRRAGDGMMTKKAKPVRAWVIVDPKGNWYWPGFRPTRNDIIDVFSEDIGNQDEMKHEGWRVVRVEIREV